MELSEHDENLDNIQEDVPTWSQPLFLLNRNGKTEEEIIDIFEKLAKDAFPDKEDINIVYAQRFGKEGRHHMFIIFNDVEITDYFIEVQAIDYEEGEHNLMFEVSAAEGCKPKEGEEQTKLYFAGLPTDIDVEQAATELAEILYVVATVKNIPQPKQWKGEFIVEFHDEESASMCLRVFTLFYFKNQSVRGAFARVQKPRTPPPSVEKQKTPPSSTEKPSSSPQNHNKYNKVQSKNSKKKYNKK